jgi:hypothetical protein
MKNKLCLINGTLDYKLKLNQNEKKEQLQKDHNVSCDGHNFSPGNGADLHH